MHPTVVPVMHLCIGQVVIPKMPLITVMQPYRRGGLA